MRWCQHAWRPGTQWSVVITSSFCACGCCPGVPRLHLLSPVSFLCLCFSHIPGIILGQKANYVAVKQKRWEREGNLSTESPCSLQPLPTFLQGSLTFPLLTLQCTDLLISTPNSILLQNSHQGHLQGHKVDTSCCEDCSRRQCVLANPAGSVE